MAFNSIQIDPHISKFLGKCSSVIYFLHILIRDFIMIFVDNSYVCWGLTVFAGIIITLIFEQLKQSKKCKWIKNMY